MIFVSKIGVNTGNTEIVSSGFEWIVVGKILQLAKYLCCYALVGLGLLARKQASSLSCC